MTSGTTTTLTSTTPTQNPLTQNTLTRRLRDERGGVAAALLLLTTVLMLVELIIFTGRISGASADLNAAASEGARVGSLSAGANGVEAAAEAGALAMIKQRGVPCSSPRVVTSDASQLQAGGVVAVEVFCIIKVNDLGFLTALSPIGDFEMRGFAFEGIDPLRVFNQ